jgi:serine/threonine protein kinase
MEYLEGDDLERVHARRGPLPPDEVIAYMAQAARGLAHAHEKGVIHRDIKPTNVFLVHTGVVKILDLGFGEMVGMAGQTGNVFDTDEGIIVGTTDFMSPEQVKDKAVDERTDLFSLGCTMYRLLTSQYAFPGVTREDRLIKRIRERHVPITDVRPGLPSSLVAIVDRLLAVRPDDRFGSAFEAADALEALIAPRGQSREAPQLVERSQPRAPSSRGLSSHRRTLEEEGIESGRDVHTKYRNELIQMKRAMSDIQTSDAKETSSSAVESWLERIGEKVGDFLSEPSAGQIVIVILLVLLVLVAAYANDAG